MKKPLLMLAVATCFMTVQANAMTPDEYKVAKERIEADYKVDQTRCDTLKDNAEDVCDKEADAKYKVGKAQLEQTFRPSDSNARALAEQQVDTAYEVAKEKCDDQQGDQKNACMKQAEADQARGKADISAMKKQ